MAKSTLRSIKYGHSCSFTSSLSYLIPFGTISIVLILICRHHFSLFKTASRQRKGTYGLLANRIRCAWRCCKRMDMNFVILLRSYFPRWLESMGSRQRNQNIGNSERCYGAKYSGIGYFCDGARCLRPPSCVDISDTNQLRFKTKTTLLVHSHCVEND